MKPTSSLAIICLTTSLFASQNTPVEGYKNLIEYSITNTNMCIDLVEKVKKLEQQNLILDNKVKRLEVPTSSINMMDNSAESVQQANQTTNNTAPQSLKNNRANSNNYLIPKGYYKIVNYWQNVRKTPTATADIAGVLKKYDIVKIAKAVKKEKNRYWLNIQYTDKNAPAKGSVDGWIYITNTNSDEVVNALEALL